MAAPEAAVLAEGAALFGIRNAVTAYLYGNLKWMLQNENSEAALMNDTLISQSILENMKSKGIQITEGLKQQAQEIEDSFYYGVVVNESGGYTFLPRTGLKGLIKDKGLPTEGKFRFIPDKRKGLYYDYDKQGYIDRFGNKWSKGPYHGNPNEEFVREWDVTLSKQGENVWGEYLAKGKTYINIRPDGQLSH